LLATQLLPRERSAAAGIGLAARGARPQPREGIRLGGTLAPASAPRTGPAAR
jgi:hypothetical protein